MQKLTLISQLLCPYVQRAAIVLKEKGVSFERRDVDMGNKPEWFLACSPLGKTPVLLVDGQAIFESAVICEYLDEAFAPRLHPQHPLERARHRAWIEFGSALLNMIAGFYNAADEHALAAKVGEITSKFQYLESVLGAGPYFAGSNFGIVDAVFGPVFRYFDVFDTIDDFGFFGDCPKVRAWRTQLAARPSVHATVSPVEPLSNFLRKRPSALARRMAAVALQPQ
jgi:glutathione S-transferase